MYVIYAKIFRPFGFAGEPGYPKLGNRVGVSYGMTAREAVRNWYGPDKRSLNDSRPLREVLRQYTARKIRLPHRKIIVTPLEKAVSSR